MFFQDSGYVEIFIWNSVMGICLESMISDTKTLWDNIAVNQL